MIAVISMFPVSYDLDFFVVKTDYAVPLSENKYISLRILFNAITEFAV